MTDLAIQVENLSKRYRIGLQEAQHETLVGAAVAWLKSPLNNFRRLRRLSAFADEEAADIIWALRDVSFAVKPGEVVGIIGRNGAGKSTLLKVLSRITPPTRGRVVLNGRVASLLEVGTGFHPELTGRENIYLNGAILGMSKAEIERKFEEIVDFSGVEKFIDTAVKRYSSGMRVRLAFSVSAHLEPEILLVDEVLAVGDIEFQKKCLGKMGQVAKEGRTILFVSHNIAAIQKLTNRAILLENGRMVHINDTLNVISQYFESFDSTSPEAFIDLRHVQPLQRNRNIQILKSLEILSNGKQTSSIAMGMPIAFRVTYSASSPIKKPRFGISIESERGDKLVSFGTVASGTRVNELIGDGQVICEVDKLPLNQGRYYVGLVLGYIHGENIETYEKVGQFYIHPNDALNSGKKINAKWGYLVWPCQWQFNDVHTDSTVNI